MAFHPGASREFVQAGAVMTQDAQTAAMHQAIQWSHRLDTEEDIETNWSEFELWLEQSPQHQEAYHRVQKGRCETELYRETVQAEGIDEEALVSELNPALPSVVVKVLWASVAATLILGAAAVAVCAYTKEVPWTPYHAAVGEVRAGQVALIGPRGTEVQTASDSEVERRMAWIGGTLDVDETLQRAVQEFNRYNERKLFIDDPTLDALPVTGRFDAHNPDLFAEDLQKSHNIDHTSIGYPGSKAGEIHLKPDQSVSANLSRAPSPTP
jgi:ferric-dicitrate binding protein FerR (iron transport regulator)